MGDMAEYDEERNVESLYRTTEKKERNKMDLNKLDGEWRTGKVLNMGKSLTLLTPV